MATAPVAGSGATIWAAVAVTVRIQLVVFTTVVCLTRELSASAEVELRGKLNIYCGIAVITELACESAGK